MSKSAIEKAADDVIDAIELKVKINRDLIKREILDGYYSLVKVIRHTAYCKLSNTEFAKKVAQEAKEAEWFNYYENFEHPAYETEVNRDEVILEYILNNLDKYKDQIGELIEWDKQRIIGRNFSCPSERKGTNNE